MILRATILAVEKARKYYYTFHESNDAYAIYLSSQVAVGLLKVWLFVFALIVLLFYRRQLHNLILYKHKKFTEDDKIINFVKQFCPNFKNAYSVNYIRHDNLLDREEAQAEFLELNYKHLVSKETVIEQASYLFDRYQKDRMAKDFDSITKYTLEPFKSKHQYIGNRKISTGTTISYNYKLSKIIPLNFDVREELKRFLVQINGETISFKVDGRGYVLSGKSQLRCFTEYWDIALDVNNKSYIASICKIKD